MSCFCYGSSLTCLKSVSTVRLVPCAGINLVQSEALLGCDEHCQVDSWLLRDYFISLSDIGLQRAYIKRFRTGNMPCHSLRLFTYQALYSTSAVLTPKHSYTESSPSYPKSRARVTASIQTPTCHLRYHLRQNLHSKSSTSIRQLIHSAKCRVRQTIQDLPKKCSRH